MWRRDEISNIKMFLDQNVVVEQRNIKSTLNTLANQLSQLRAVIEVWFILYRDP